ncbi:MAG TPA: hypothetical protein VK666_13740, partial [Chryseolinea sp.]|nr:hypothetical protein [Chryseolinea sp.]
IVLRHPATPHTAAAAATLHLKESHPQTMMDLSGPWTVRFDTAFGGPAAPILFDSLQDWSHHADSSIRYYSGTALYTKSFDLAYPATTASLDLGTLANIATVTLNGLDCGTAWTPPYKVDISKALRKGKNELQIAVTNTWANRLTGDQRLPEPKRITWTTAPYHLDGKLLKSGLLGPVKIEFDQRAH